MNQKLRWSLTMMLVLLLLGGPLAAANSDMAAHIPLFQEYAVDIITPEGEVEYSFRSTFAVADSADQVTVNIDGPRYTSTIVLDSRLVLQHSELVVLEEADVERIGFDTRESYFDTERNEIVVNFYLDGVKIDSRWISFGEPAVDVDTIGLYLQSLLMQGRTDFHGNLFDMNTASRYNLRSQVLSEAETADLAEGSRVPPQVREVLTRDEGVRVFSMGYTGLTRLFYPHRFYAVLTKESPYEILAFWGGSARTLRYHLYTAKP